MKERRTLVESLNAGDVVLSDREKEFVLGRPIESSPDPQDISQADEKAQEKTKDLPPTPTIVEPKQNSKILPQISSRVLITTRATPEVASALKRASLQRQLDGIEPYYVQEILDEAIGDWLRKHGHLV